MGARVGADGAAYSSAVVSEAHGIRQYVQLVGRGLIGVSAETGELLWGYNRVANNVANITTPVVRGNYVFGTTAYNTGSGLVKIVRDGGDNFAGDLQPRNLRGALRRRIDAGALQHIGSVHTGGGDLDGNGDADFVVGAPLHDTGGDLDSGVVYVVLQSEPPAVPPAGECDDSGCIVFDDVSGALLDVNAGALSAPATVGISSIDAGSLPGAPPAGMTLLASWAKSGTVLASA